MSRYQAGFAQLKKQALCLRYRPYSYTEHLQDAMKKTFLTTTIKKEGALLRRWIRSGRAPSKEAKPGCLVKPLVQTFKYKLYVQTLSINLNYKHF